MKKNNFRLHHFLCLQMLFFFYITNLKADTIHIVGDSIFCSGGSAKLRLNSPNPLEKMSSFQWYLNGNVILDATSDSYDAQIPGSYKVAWMDTLEKMNISSDFKVIKVMNPNVSISGTSNRVCSGSSALLQMTILSSSSSILHYEWLLNDIHYSSAGQYISIHKGGDYRAIIVNSWGCQDTSPPYHIDEFVSPSIDITCNTTPLCSGIPAQLHSTILSGSGNVNSYQWYLNGIQISAASSSAYSTLQSGDFKLWVNNSSGCSAYSNILSIHLEDTPIPVINGVSVFCQNSSTQLDAYSSVINPLLHVQYQWRFNKQDIAGAISKELSNVSSVGNYELMVNTEGGCVGKSPEFKVDEAKNPLPVISGPHFVCHNSTVLLNLLGSQLNQDEVIQIQWFLNSQEISGASDYTLTVSDTGIYSASILTSSGCSAISQDFKLRFDPLQIHLSSKKNIYGYHISCYGDSDAAVLAVIDYGISPYLFQWSNHETTANIQGLTSGKYFVFVTDSLNCSVMDSMRIQSPPPLIADAGTNQYMCVGDSLRLGGNLVASGGVGPYTYFWESDAQMDDVHIDHPIIRWKINQLNKNTFLNTLTITDSLGCKAFSSQLLQVFSRDSISISQSGTSDFYSGLGIKLSAYAPSAVSFEWSDHTFNQSMYAFLSGWYSVLVTDSNGCRQRDSIRLDYKPENLLRNYVAYVSDYALFSQNNFSSGSVGILSENKNGKYGAVFEKNTKMKDVSSFVKAAKIEIKTGSIINKSIHYSANGVVLPSFYTNPYNSANDINVADNTTIHLDDSIYGKISIGKNAKLIFSAPKIYIDGLSMNHKEGISLQFANCCQVVIKNHIDFGKNAKINADNKFLTFYVAQDDDVNSPLPLKAIEVDPGCIIRANMYAPNGEILIHSATASKPNLLYGTFISKRLHAGFYTEWNLNNSTPICHLQAKIDKIIPVRCFGEKNGAIFLSVSGGISPYRFSIDGKTFKDFGTFTNLPSGSYQIRVEDALGNIFNFNTMVSGPVKPLQMSLTSNAIPSDSLQNNLSCYQITAQAMGGSGPISFSWSGSSIINHTSPQSILACSDYAEIIRCLATDSNHCLVRDSLLLNASKPKLGAMLSIPCADCISSFSPLQGKRYVLSAWVKEENAGPAMVTYKNPEISIEFLSENISLPLMHAQGQIIDGWQRIQETFEIPPNALNIKIKLNSLKGNSFFDDIRIFPLNGNMKSYVYDPFSLKLSAELDENNYASFYEYDEDGRLTRIKKETERGILSIQEIKENTVKK